MSRPAGNEPVVRRWLVGLAVVGATAALAVALWPASPPPAVGSTPAIVEAEPAPTVVLVLPGGQGAAPAAISQRSPTRSRARPAANARAAPPTNVEYLEQFVDEVCACPDLACVRDANDYYARNVGQTTRAPDNGPMTAAFARERACLERIRQEEGG